MRERDQSSTRVESFVAVGAGADAASVTIPQLITGTAHTDSYLSTGSGTVERRDLQKGSQSSVKPSPLRLLCLVLSYLISRHFNSSHYLVPHHYTLSTITLF
jgi:hypothetical protein